MNIWNTICSELLEEKSRQATEKEYQNKVFTHFYYLLGWYCERVKQQYQERSGRTYVYPDMVFFSNNEKLFVIEMKKPTHTQHNEDIEQLSSYMRLLQVQFGIYIGEHIELYYKPYNCDKLTSVLKIELTPNSKKGEKFVELFKQENFSIEGLSTFCKSQIEEIEKEKQINEYINELTTSKGQQLLIDLLTSKLQTENYTKESITKIIESIEINVSNKKQAQNTYNERVTILNTTPIENKFKTTHKKKQKKDKTHYRLNGNGNYGKGKLALAIVKLFVKENPHFTYNELEDLIPLPIRECNEIQLGKLKETDSQKDRRWFEDPDDLMTSSDNIKFAFTTQIGIRNIEKIVDFGKQQGYSIEPAE